MGLRLVGGSRVRGWSLLCSGMVMEEGELYSRQAFKCGLQFSDAMSIEEVSRRLNFDHHALIQHLVG